MVFDQNDRKKQESHVPDEVLSAIHIPTVIHPLRYIRTSEGVCKEAQRRPEGIETPHALSPEMQVFC
jgi:hypothetical protein